jgi:hypothetical protein
MSFARFPQLNVTLVLALENKRADDCLGASGIRNPCGKCSNSFVFMILTSNFYGLKILQTIFAEPAPVKAFRRGGGGGIRRKRVGFPKPNVRKQRIFSTREEIFFDFS